MLSYLKSYRKLVGGKWYKIKRSYRLINLIYYTRTKPFSPNIRIIRKYKYE